MQHLKLKLILVAVCGVSSLMFYALKVPQKAYAPEFETYWMIPNRELGVLALGLFVGSLIGFGLLGKRASVKVIITAIGAALSGSPVLFMIKLDAERWVYPIGLALGLLMFRLKEARNVVAGVIT